MKLLHSEESFLKNSKQTIIHHVFLLLLESAYKIKFSDKDFFSKREHIRRRLRICLHLLEKSLTEDLIFVQWELLLETS